MLEPDVARVFLDFSRRKLLDECWPRICQCVAPLSTEQLWWRPHETSNSIGNLLLHLDGNVRQWLLAALGGEAGERDRPAEFAERQQIPWDELRDRLDSTLRRVAALLEAMDAPALLRKYTIQEHWNVTALEAIYHVVEHFGMHYGQIVYITKLLTGSDLGFYRHLDQKK